MGTADPGDAQRGLCWIDGRVVPLAEATVPVTDRAFLLADSVFDTVRTYGGRPLLLGDHLDRLRRSAAELFLPVPWSDARLTAVVEELLAAWSGEATLRLMVTRGDGGSGLRLPEPQTPRLVVLLRPLNPPEPGLVERGVAVVRATGGKDAGVPAHVKSGSYLGNVLALREARARGGYEALLRGPDGTWAEATTSNLFVVRGGVLITPGAAEHILPGITRALVLAAARADGLEVAERPVDDALLGSAEEAFLTSSIKEVLPVVLLDGQPVGDGAPGPVTARVRGLFRRAVDRIQAGGHDRLVEAFGP